MGKNICRFNDFEVNKSVEDAIVYQSATGRIYIRHEDIQAEKQGYSKEAFCLLKKDSDEIYTQTESADHIERRRCYFVDDFSRYEKKADMSYKEKNILDKLNLQLDEAIKLLTDTQKRRLNLHYSCGMSLRKIAKLEKVDHKAVYNSIAVAQKKIRDYFIEIRS